MMAEFIFKPSWYAWNDDPSDHTGWYDKDEIDLYITQLEKRHAKELARVKGELESARGEILKWSQTVAEGNSQLAAVREELESKKVGYYNMMSDTDQARKSACELQAELNKAQARIKELEDDVELLQKCCDQHDLRVAERNNAREELSAAQEKIKALEAALETVVANGTAIRNQISADQNQIEFTKDNVKFLISSLEIMASKGLKTT